MRPSTFVRETVIPCDRGLVWNWHNRPGAFERLAPPWQNIGIIDPGSGVAERSRTVLRLRKGGLPLRWVAEHRNVEAPSGFDDVQLSGPFRSWTHLHRFEEHPNGTLLRDEISYALPGGAPGRFVAGRAVRRDLDRLFRYRHAVTAADLRLHGRFAGRERLRVAVSGAGGLIGSAVCALLTTGGHEVVRLVRRPVRHGSEVEWDPERGVVDIDRLDEIDGIVHLAGENIAAGRWSRRRMERIRGSRVQGTRALLTSIERLRRPPSVVVTASAIGIYGDRGAAPLTEASRGGEGFLADLGREWEESATSGAFSARRVLARFGVVLSLRGGALARMLPPFRLGLGGRLGDGSQFTSWISIDDAASAVVVALLDERLEGAVNVTAPTPVTNLELTGALSRALGRPALFPVPKTALRLAFGQMADEALLSSSRVLPQRLESAAFEFRHPSIDVALAHLLGRPPASSSHERDDRGPI